MADRDFDFPLLKLILPREQEAVKRDAGRRPTIILFGPSDRKIAANPASEADHVTQIYSLLMTRHTNPDARFSGSAQNMANKSDRLGGDHSLAFYAHASLFCSLAAGESRRSSLVHPDNRLGRRDVRRCIGFFGRDLTPSVMVNTPRPQTTIYGNLSLAFAIKKTAPNVVTSPTAMSGTLITRRERCIITPSCIQRANSTMLQ